MTDNGLAALATAIHVGRNHQHDPRAGERPHAHLISEREQEDAAAILGPRGVFLPEGLGPVMVGMAKEIAALRDALDGLAKAAQEVIAADGAIARQEPGADQRWDCALAALDAESDRAAAKEADHD